MPKTTQKHLEAFEEEGRYWIEQFGLKDYEVFFVRAPLEEYRALCSADYEGRMATITLATEWSGEIIPLTIEMVKHSARHEIVELALADLWHLAHVRFVSRDELSSARESIVKRFEKLLNKTERS